jgi:large subunit ribosomal protein L11
VAKKIINTLKLNLKAGAANPAPPVGPILGQAGVNIMDFCSKYNEMTKEKRGETVPALVTVYEDRSFSIELKLPPVSAMIMKMINLKQGSGTPNSKKVGTLTMAQVEEIATAKLPDLNTIKVESAKQMVIGTARSMGVEVKE